MRNCNASTHVTFIENASPFSLYAHHLTVEHGPRCLRSYRRLNDVYEIPLTGSNHLPDFRYSPVVYSSCSHPTAPISLSKWHIIPQQPRHSKFTIMYILLSMQNLLETPRIEREKPQVSLRSGVNSRLSDRWLTYTEVEPHMVT